MITRVSFFGADGVFRKGVLSGYVSCSLPNSVIPSMQILALVMDEETRAVVPVDLDRLHVLEVGSQGVQYRDDPRIALQRARARR